MLTILKKFDNNRLKWIVVLTSVNTLCYFLFQVRRVHIPFVKFYFINVVICCTSGRKITSNGRRDLDQVAGRAAVVVTP